MTKEQQVYLDFKHPWGKPQNLGMDEQEQQKDSVSYIVVRKKECQVSEVLRFNQQQKAMLTTNSNGMFLTGNRTESNRTFAV